MNAKNLEKKLSDLGLPLMEVQNEGDINQTLVEVIQSEDARYWEVFPVLLVRAHKTRNFDVEKVEAYLSNESDQRKWRSLLKMSLALYPVMEKYFEFAKQMEKGLSMEEKEWVSEFRNKARTRDHDHFELENKQFSFSRLKTLLDNYIQEESLKAQKIQAKHDEFSLEYALSQFFSPKQKELFKKKLGGELFTKTEKEYFSRVVKKKISALANPELHHLAQKLLE